MVKTEVILSSGEKPLRTPASRQDILFIESLMGVFAISLWILLFLGGVLVGTEAYRNKFGNIFDPSWNDALQTIFMVVTCYTLSNVALLCCLSSWLGMLGRRARINGRRNSSLDRDPKSEYIGALVRGFFTYLILFSGMIIFTGTESFAKPGQDEYIRLAGAGSLFSFLAGHNPSIFSRISKQVEDLFESRMITDDDSGSSTEDRKKNATLKD